MIAYNRIGKYAIAYVALLVFFAITYSAVINSRYAFLDDYTYVFSANHHTLPGMTAWLISSGRPIYAVSINVFTLVSKIGDLRWVRLFSLAGIAALCQLLIVHLRATTTLPRSACIAAGILIGLMPPLQVYASWACTALFPWSALLAGLSFFALNNRTTSEWKAMALSLALLVSALAIYQPSAMVFFVFAGAAWVPAEKLPSIRAILRAATVMGTALAVDYAATKMLPIVIYHNFTPYGRTALVTNLDAKASWFLTEVVTDALNLPFILGSGIIAIFAAVFIGSGLGIFFWRRRSSWLARVMLAITLVPLAYLPNLIVQESWASYRTQVALTGLLAVYSVIALEAWLRLLRIDRATPAFMLAAIIGCAWVARHNVETEFTIPQVEELRLVSAYLRSDGNLESAKQVYFVPASWQDSLAPLQRYDEFGIPSSEPVWTPPGIAWLILSGEHSPGANKLGTAIVGPAAQAPKGATVVDLSRALHGLPPP